MFKQDHTNNDDTEDGQTPSTRETGLWIHSPGMPEKMMLPRCIVKLVDVH